MAIIFTDRARAEQLYNYTYRYIDVYADDRSAWGRGVRTYARELLDSVKLFLITSPVCDSFAPLRNAMLNGARDWDQYSYGGCSLVYNQEICERLCSPSEQDRKHHGGLAPNSREEWLDLQARALYQASIIVHLAYDAALYDMTHPVA